MAVQAALTGHLVFSTLHTNDAPSAITRLPWTRRAALPDQRHGAGRAGAAPGAHPVPAVPKDVSEAFKDRVNQQPSIDALRRQAVADGMRPLRLAGALRVAEGLTTLDEVLLATPPVD
jgi:general secretion pathway protein E